MAPTPSHVLLVLALATAGCIGEDAPDESLTTTAEGPGDDTTLTSSAEGNATAPDAAPVLEVIEVHIEERTDAAVVMCPPTDGRDHCPGVGGWPGYDQGDDMDGSIVAMDLTLTWEATYAGNEELRFYVFACLGEECAQIANAEGTSPLVLDKVNDEGPYDWYGIEVSTVNRAGGAAAVFASLEQSFTVNGTITVAPTPAS